MPGAMAIPDDVGSMTDGGWSEDLSCNHISGTKPTQVCRATCPIFAFRTAYRFQPYRSRLACLDNGTQIQEISSREIGR